MTAIGTPPPVSMVELADQIRQLDPHRTLADVMADLRSIQVTTTGADPGHRQLEQDGVGSFNFMYLKVTERIAGLDQASPFINRLAVVFAEFFLRTYRADAERKTYVSKAWEPLFQKRAKARIAALQFAIAGMNAHINNDLSWALMQVWHEFPGDDQQLAIQHAEFRAINGVLADAQSEVRTILQSQFMCWLDHVMRHLDDDAAGFSVATARERAWQRAIVLRNTPSLIPDTLHERQVGFQSHLILEPRLDFRG